jgi:hypothetical protein
MQQMETIITIISLEATQHTRGGQHAGYTIYFQLQPGL